MAWCRDLSTICEVEASGALGKREQQGSRQLA